MKASWEKTETNKGVLTVETDEQTVAQALDKAFKKVSLKVNIPGFRKGKVPRKLFEQRFGVETLYQDALDIMLPEAYEAAIRETGIEPVDRPEVDVEQIEQGKPMIFKATVTVKPEVKLGDYKGLKVEEKDYSVSAEDVSSELERMQKQQGVLKSVEDAPAEKGDKVIIDFEGFKDGVAFEGGKGENYTLELGSNSFIPGFEDQLIGVKAGEEKTVEVTFPEEYHAEDLAGQPATFQVKVHEVKRTELPELDDEFAQDVSEFETLAELKADVENKLNEGKQKEKENDLRNQLVELAANNAEIEIPEVMVEHEVGHMLQNFEQQLSYQGLNLDLYSQFTGQSTDDLKEQFKADAAKKVRADLVLEAIAKAENLEVTEEELENELKETAESVKRDVAEVRQILEANGQIEVMKAQLRNKKTIDLLVSESQNAA
ncbi:trigger factor [Risungbinella massiliensis]|uniref:trigger factor n=1 Tax=Risungbinella massiliensis TaxID=1329796 RepID=UPI0005CC0F2A|nr:trigger factor [Risungbinella massiliensis]